MCWLILSPPYPRTPLFSPSPPSLLSIFTLTFWFPTYFSSTFSSSFLQHFLLHMLFFRLFLHHFKFLHYPQAIYAIRVWGVGRDNGRDFAYVSRDKQTRKHMCHVFRSVLLLLPPSYSSSFSYNFCSCRSSFFSFYSKRPLVESHNSFPDLIGGGVRN